MSHHDLAQSIGDAGFQIPLDAPDLTEAEVLQLREMAGTILDALEAVSADYVNNGAPLRDLLAVRLIAGDVRKAIRGCSAWLSARRAITRGIERRRRRAGRVTS